MPKTPVVLIAEDDESVSFAIESVVSRKFSCNIVLAKDGNEAWEKLKSNDVDLIISDWNMPNMSGDELLQDVRESEEYRSIPFIMLTARNDKDSVITAVQAGVTDYISKPFHNKEVVDKVRMYLDSGHINTDGMSTSSKNDKDIQNRLKLEIDRCLKDPAYVVPVLPNIAQDIIELLNENNSNADQLARLVGTDVSMSAKLISTSNSLFFKGNSIITSLSEAIIRLGLKETENYVMIYSQNSMFSTDHVLYKKLLKKYWEHSYATALCSRSIAKHLKLPDKEMYFTIGLLHDVGKLMLLKILHDFAEQGEEYEEDIVLNALDLHHEVCGGFILKKWKFAVNFIEAAENHHINHLSGKESTASLIINLADQLVKINGYSMAGPVELDLENVESARKLMLGTKALNSILKTVDEEITELITTI